MWRVRITYASFFPVFFWKYFRMHNVSNPERGISTGKAGQLTYVSYVRQAITLHTLSLITNILWLHGSGCQAILLLEELEEGGKDTVSPPPSRHWKLQVSQEGDINIVSMDLRDTDRSDRTTGLQMQTSQAESLNLMELINGSERRNRMFWMSSCSVILLKHLCFFQNGFVFVPFVQHVLIHTACAQLVFFSDCSVL